MVDRAGGLPQFRPHSWALWSQDNYKLPPLSWSLGPGLAPTCCDGARGRSEGWVGRSLLCLCLSFLSSKVSNIIYRRDRGLKERVEIKKMMKQNKP